MRSLGASFCCKIWLNATSQRETAVKDRARAETRHPGHGSVPALGEYLLRVSLLHLFSNDLLVFCQESLRRQFGMEFFQGNLED